MISQNRKQAPTPYRPFRFWFDSFWPISMVAAGANAGGHRNRNRNRNRKRYEQVARRMYRRCGMR
jgi:hypothetical protein